LDEEEFKILLTKCLQQFITYQAMQNKETYSKSDLPQAEDLQNSVNILFAELGPKIDSNHDGTIDFVEFEKLGQYIKEEFEGIQVEQKLFFTSKIVCFNFCF
jgi:hypothetical protein